MRSAARRSGMRDCGAEGRQWDIVGMTFLGQARCTPLRIAKADATSAVLSFR
jgi:hypothetical protein